MTTLDCNGCLDSYDDEDTGFFYSSITKTSYCEGCYQADLDDASRVTFIEPTGTRTIHIGEVFCITEHGDDYTDNDITREYIKTDEWRGYYETTIEGFTTVMEGWTTGGWSDEVGQRKALFNDWAQALLEHEIEIPCTVAIVLDTTSNLFSTAVSVMVKDTDKDFFIKYLGEELPALKEALK